MTQGLVRQDFGDSQQVRFRGTHFAGPGGHSTTSRVALLEPRIVSNDPTS